jgi:Rrf2 family protein
MRITATEEYGLRCLVMLAKRGSNDPLTLSDIGDGEGMSQPYAAKIMNLLRQAGLAESIRGRNGGYILAYPANKITLTDAFDAMGEPLFSPSHCDKFGSPAAEESCVHTGDCSVRDVWAGMQRLIGNVMSQITLAELVSASEGGGLSIFSLVKRQLADAAAESN